MAELKVSRTVTLDSEILAWLAQQAERRNQSLSAVVNNELQKSYEREQDSEKVTSS